MVSPQEELRRDFRALRVLGDRFPLSGWPLFHRLHLRTDGDQPESKSPMEPIFCRTEALKIGKTKRSFVALSNLEDEFVDKTNSDRKEIVEKIARGETYLDGKVTYGPSNRRHLFGTDPLGRDLLTRVLIGGRISLAVGFAATIVSVCIGVLWGATAGFLGGKTDTVMMRFADILYALPFTVIVILLMVMFGRKSFCSLLRSEQSNG